MPLRLRNAVAVLAAAFLFPAVAFAQGGVLQSGVVTPGHGTQWLANGIIADSGSPASTSVGCPLTGCTFTGPVIFDGLSGDVASGVGWYFDALGNLTANSLTTAGNVTGNLLTADALGGLTATGANQTGAYNLTTVCPQYALFTTVNAGTGVALCANVPVGGTETLYDLGSNPLLVYPPIGGSGQINSSGVNIPISVPAAVGFITLLRDGVNSWHTIAATNLAAGIPANGGVLITSGTLGTAVAASLSGLSVGAGTLATVYGTSPSTSLQGSMYNAANGVAPLDSNSKVPFANLPASVQTGGGSMGYSGVPTTSTLRQFQVPYACTIPANLSTSLGYVNTLATSTTNFALGYEHAGTVNTVGNIVFTSASHAPTYPTTAAISLAAGDVLQITSPGTADATLADVVFTIACAKATP
jgi:hypothetical protein